MATIRPMCSVDILLATFNGEAYLPALLDSIECQTHGDWRLVVRDDGSTDGTLKILSDWSQRHPERIRLIIADGHDRGARKNFAALLDLSDAPYFMFCDQDDVWMPEKIKLFFDTMLRIEGQCSAGTPVLVHSDLVVVDRDLRQIAPSFWQYQRLVPRGARPNARTLVLSNYVTGCASMGNTSLRRLARPIPDEAAMHDWWLALVAANLGELVQIEAPTVLYRQHENNQIGARSWSLANQIDRSLRRPQDSVRRTRAAIEKTQRQAAVFADRFDGVADPKTIGLFRAYSGLREKRFVERKRFMFRNRLWPNHWLRAVAMWCLL